VVVVIPLFGAGPGVDGVEVAVAATEESDVGRDCGGTRDAHLVVNLRVIAGLELPDKHASPGVQRVEIAVPASDVEEAIGYRRRGVDHVAGGESPFDVAGSGVQGVDVVVAAAEVDHPAREHGRREEDVEGIGHELGTRRGAVDSGSGEAALAFGLEFPFDLSGLRFDGVEIAVEAGEIDQAVGGGGRRVDGGLTSEFPAEGAIGGGHGIEIVVGAAEVNGAATAGEDRTLPLVLNFHLTVESAGAAAES
jgi:hypothetical protein